MSTAFLTSAGRMLERAYRNDNGLPPDVDPAHGGERAPAPTAVPAATLVMAPFVVSSTKIHDARLLAVYGLYERDAGNEPKAAELLEAAARQAAVRPMAYLGLAEIRFAQASARPRGTGGRLSAQQAEAILEPVRMMGQFPPLADTYRLMVQILENTEAKPTDRDIDELAAGAALFPRYTALLYHAARECALSGHATQAATLIDLGMRFTLPKNQRTYFEHLRAVSATGR